MSNKITRCIEKLHQGQKGMTGLETAIILIAFVTVASVLAYSVLSAGIFSAEKSKSTIYGGLAQASATMMIKSHVVATGNTSTNVLDYIYFLVALTIPEENLDMDAVMVKFTDNTTEGTVDRENTWGSWNATSNKWTSRKILSMDERGTSNILEGDEVHEIRIDVPSGASVGVYEWFRFEMIAPKGASITIKRVLPGFIESRMDLN